MNQLKVINEQTVLNKDFKIYGTNEDPLFLAQDVAKWIEHSDVSMMLKNIDLEEKLIQTMLVSGQNREVWMLTEDGLYEVLMQSRKKIAKQFKKEIKRILKDIRLCGTYSIPQTYVDALKLAVHQQELLEQQNQFIGELKPKADYVDKILRSKTLVTITQIAKDYGMSGSLLNSLLFDLEIQFKQSGQWLLYRKHHAKGYTMSETLDLSAINGVEKVVMNTKWTQKGRMFLYEELKKVEILPTIERE